MSRFRRAIRRTFDDWEKEIARPILVAVATAFVLLAFSLLFTPVREFLFGDGVEYPLYCTAESYSTSADSARIEVLLVNTTAHDLTRSDLERALKGSDRVVGSASPDLELVYDRDFGGIARAEADTEFNKGKGELAVRNEKDRVVISPFSLSARAVLRVNIDVTELPNALSRDAHRLVPLRVAQYEEACYTR